MVILDTSVIIDFLVGDPKLASIMKEMYEKEEIKTTSITEYELLRHKTEIKKQAAEHFLSGAAAILSFDRAAAKEAAKLFVELQDKGKMINENDLLISAIALANEEILFTRDKKLSHIGKDNIKIV